VGQFQSYLLQDHLPFGLLPAVTDGDHIVAEVIGASSYVADVNGLAGSTPLERGLILAAASNIYAAFNDCISALGEKDEDKKKEMMASQANDKIPRFLSYLEKIIQKNGNGVLVGDKFSFADAFLYYFCEVCKQWGLKEPVEANATVEAHFVKFGAVESVKAWVEKRPESMF